MNKNNKIISVVVAVVLIGVSFYGGMKYQQSKIPARGNFAAFAGGAAGAGARGGARGGAAGGGIVSGNIISKDATSITVQMRDGSSKIVLISGSTNIMKAAAGSVSDLNVGTTVTTTGTANSDGSVTATMVQIRPATTTPAQ